MTWQETVKTVQARRASQIPPQWRVSASELALLNDLNTIEWVCTKLTPRELTITNEASATALAHKIANREYTSVEVTKAFCHRAVLVHQATNCLTEIFCEEAYARAQYCDDYLAKNNRTLGPLHGVPVSIKENIDVAGKMTS
ncbi:glutaminyl-tRNA synthase (glutamine-hydrolysing) [Synchytrium microbalum]|uniref:Glutaminyl-tRNA synthase (Glutamine-hydrolysing) n=1 Tax=Synchytrium microbalum TaxID=1806994 RepID=A0A507C9N3_9FUNG|nr:glutaminyl-tRNA synthase (glutamine-hydrolysing) [Synchytrium microbalum]TPX34684.1 glutaminyl-tRNA synthase (glutamine-hydrolysing) [Synchytrium microbalum]